MLLLKPYAILAIAAALVVCGCSSTPAPTQDPVMSQPVARPLSKAEQGMLDSIEKLPEDQRRQFLKNNGRDIAGYARTNSTFRDRLRVLIPKKNATSDAPKTTP